MLRRFLLIILLCGSLGASLPSLAQAEHKPCSPAKPAAKPITTTSNSIGTMQISWQVGESSPMREWVSYWSENEAIQVHSKEPGLEKGSARSTELTKLRQGEPYKILLSLEYHSCVEERQEGNDLTVAWSLAPTVGFYNDVVTEGKEVLTRFPEGEVVSAKFGTYGTNHSTTYLPTVKGNTANYINCGSLDSDWTFENPKGGGTATWKILTWAASECSQSGYCATGETVGLQLKPLPSLVTDTYQAQNGYRFSHTKLGFTVTCNGGAAANIVESPLANPVSEVLEGYWSNGRYEKTAPPNFDMDDGGHYGETYGNAGNMEREGSKGQEIIQPKIYWYYLGYEAPFAEDVIPTATP